MQVITIDGKEYVLVPKEDLQPVNPEPRPNTQPKPQEEVLNDFLPVESPAITTQIILHEIATIEERKEAIRIVDATSISNIPSATPKKSEYREKFLTHDLSPNDIRTFSRPNFGVIKQFNEIPEIANLDTGAAPSKSTGPSFYGPGVQFDVT